MEILFVLGIVLVLVVWGWFYMKNIRSGYEVRDEIEKNEINRSNAEKISTLNQII